jgi:hypothetical protein
MAAAKLKDPPAPGQCVEGDVVISLILQTVTHVRLSPRRTDATHAGQHTGPSEWFRR